MTDAPETGVCDYAPIYTVTTYTSGNELRGPAVHFGKFDSDRSARQALADAGFTNGQFGWRKGYTDATIVKSTEYTNHRADLSADLVRAGIKAAMEVAELERVWFDIDRIADDPEAIAAIVARVTEGK